MLLAATPLGLPADASARLVSTLGSADVVAAEDTRRVRTLAQALDVRIAGKVVSLFDQNEATRVPALVDEVRGGATVLVVSDAGMPVINDPGYRLVAACVEAGLPVSCLPGPSAVTTALAVSGLPADRFCFEGFPPRKHSARKTWLAGLASRAAHGRVLRVSAAARGLPAGRGRGARAGAPRGGVPRADQDARGDRPRLAWPSWPTGRPTACSARSPSCLAGAEPRADLETLVAEVTALVDDGARVKDACAQVVAANPGAPSRRELYDAVLRSRD